MKTIRAGFFLISLICIAYTVNDVNFKARQVSDRASQFQPLTSLFWGGDK